MTHGRSKCSVSGQFRNNTRTNPLSPDKPHVSLRLGRSLDPDNLRDQLGDDNRHHFALDLTNHTAANQFADIRGPPAGAI